MGPTRGRTGCIQKVKVDLYGIDASAGEMVEDTVITGRLKPSSNLVLGE